MLAQATLILCAFFGLLLGGGMAWIVGRLRIIREVPAPYTRKIFHFAVYTGAAGTQALGGLGGTMAYGSTVAALVLVALARSDGFPFYEALARPSDRPHRSLFILVPLVTTALGGLVSNILVGGYATVGYLVCGWGDAVGEPVGTRWGRHRYRVPSLAGVAATRSVEGSLAVLISGTIAAAIGLALLGVGGSDLVLGALLCGGVGALVEAVSNHGFDNLTVQVAASVAAWWLVG
jgi:phytol kinase